MSALVCFAVFLAGVAVCLHMGWALIWAMLLGIAAFGALGLRRGFSLRTLWGFAWGQGRKMCSLLVIYVLIGMIPPSGAAREPSRGSSTTACRSSRRSCSFW